MFNGNKKKLDHHIINENELIKYILFNFKAFRYDMKDLNQTYSLFYCIHLGVTFYLIYLSIEEVILTVELSFF